MHTAFVITEHTYALYRALAVALALPVIFDLKEIEGRVIVIHPDHTWGWIEADEFSIDYRMLDRTDISLWFAELAE